MESVGEGDDEKIGMIYIRNIKNGRLTFILSDFQLYSKQVNKFGMKRPLQRLQDIESLPTQYERRNTSDKICIYFGVAFSIILIVMAIVMWNYGNFKQVNFPADSNGKLCGIDYPQYPFVYFVNPPQINRRVCVEACPKKGDSGLQCMPTDTAGCKFHYTKGYEVLYYDNEVKNTRSGQFCYPTDQTVRDELLQNSLLKNRDEFFNSLDTIMLCFFIACGISLLYMFLVQCIPNFMNYAAVGLGIIVILGSAICVFLYRTSQHTVKTVLAVCLLFVLLIILLTICKNNDSWRMHSIFLSYSTKMIRDRGATIFYIPIFFVFLVAFIAILVLEFTAYWSSGKTTFDAQTSLYYKVQGTGPIMTVFLIIQGIWGLTFIKQAFNFCISTQAVNWYFQTDEGFCYSFKLMFHKHFGSIVAGAFITGFLSLADFIFDFLKPDENANPDGYYTKAFKCCCLCCFKIFDLVRSDAMAFISLTGNPFCNSARYCEYLCDRSIIMDYSQSTSRAYRLCAHFLLTGIIAILALYVKGNISIYALLTIMVQTIFVSTLFISLHADATEAIQIIFLTDEEFVRQQKDENEYNRENLHHLNELKKQPQLVRDVKQEREIQKRYRRQQQND